MTMNEKQQNRQRLTFDPDIGDGRIINIHLYSVRTHRVAFPQGLIVSYHRDIVLGVCWSCVGGISVGGGVNLDVIDNKRFFFSGGKQKKL